MSIKITCNTTNLIISNYFFNAEKDTETNFTIIEIKLQKIRHSWKDENLNRTIL